MIEKIEENTKEGQAVVLVGRKVRGKLLWVTTVLDEAAETQIDSLGRIVAMMLDTGRRALTEVKEERA